VLFGLLFSFSLNWLRQFLFQAFMETQVPHLSVVGNCKARMLGMFGR
jgi:hypothetical protein